MDVRLFLVLFFLVSCMPQAQVGQGNYASKDPGTNNPAPDLNNTPKDTNWNYLGKNSLSITINATNLNNAYIIGQQVQNHLAQEANFSDVDYCLISDFSLGGVSLQLRSRVVPISYYDFNARKNVRVLRADFNDVTNSSQNCGGALMVQDQTGQYVPAPSLVVPKYDPLGLCSSCTSLLTSTKLRLFKKDLAGSSLYEVSESSLRLSGLSLRVDPNNAGGGNIGSCSNNECQARGFSCCLDNQCVKEGAIRPSAYTHYSSQISQTEKERLQNPLAYLKYPHIYYICASTPPSTPKDPSPGNSYDPALEQLKKDYNCVEHIKSQGTSTPFHNELLNRTYASSPECLTSSDDSDETMYYQNVFKRLYQTCGCAKSELSEMIDSCPAYEYSVTSRGTNNEPTRIDCYTPPVSGPIEVVTTVIVPSRSAPHRFFDKDGFERDITVSATGLEQEGEKFEYLDAEKLLPQQKPFSMNAILGQMSLTLDKALPAKVLTVKPLETYIISTQEGYYTPCPMCAKDSWFSSFSAHPPSTMGVGLQAVGHNTERDAFGNNITSGNYEDTIFGRACWLPPTMIPFSHSAMTSTQAQRENRLLTQTALFVNGYQRDWFGFNKGALIGSFDGVTWFAVGKGRIVRSTTKKLYLAINAPFADLASPTSHVVKVQPLNEYTQAAEYDYDPRYHLSHPYQNEGGNCQANHLCSKDSDCISRLGWEYMCADVREMKTQWPSFSAEAQELAGTSQVKTIDKILQQQGFNTASTKRCVYRGAGAPCVTNPKSVSDLNKRKTLTCAPNFYCARTSENVFNSQVARWAAPLEDHPVSRNHLFGQDANVLGRPLSYVASTDTGLLPAAVRSTLQENLSQYESLANSSTTGICRPGKGLPEVNSQVALSDPFEQHSRADSARRTDYINQIGSCNSGLFSDYRYSSCPVINSSGNYEMFSEEHDLIGYHVRARNQNSCGLDTIRNGTSLNLPVDTLSTLSPFRNIEGATLPNQVAIEPTLVRDACLRRAGQVCHTDLDCSPNKFHADKVDYFDVSFFGNQAEQKYHSEYLVCGQGDPKPGLYDGDSIYQAYDQSKNVCCREIGKDLTTYTSDTPNSFVRGPASYEPLTSGLKGHMAPGIAPNDPKRYSRFATVENLSNLPAANRPALSANIDNPGSLFSSNIMTSRQWATLNEANSETCCGGGWIRKFADGTNDWSKRNRVSLDVTNFQCINSRSVLLTTPEDLNFTPMTGQYSSLGQLQTWLSQDYGDYCKDASGNAGSCAQYDIVHGTSDSPPNISDFIQDIEINTITPNYKSVNRDFYFMPRSADSDPRVYMDPSNTASDARKNIKIKLPSYVPSNLNITKSIRLVNEDGAQLICSSNTAINLSGPTQEADAACTSGGTSPNCCYHLDQTTRTLQVVLEDNNVDYYEHSFTKGKKLGVNFAFDAPGRGYIDRRKPAASGFYLRRLARLELTGIPQIAHEPLRCSDNYNRLVPGLLKPDLKYFSDLTDANSWTGTGLQQRLTTHHLLQHEPVFSAHEFKCCSPLGRVVQDTSKCCSGYGVPFNQSGREFVCALPAGTNLMVYFNRFVSNEGTGSDRPGGGLNSADFDALTGEPLLTSSVSDKIRAMGNAFCESGRVRQGGAFGAFEVEPQGRDTNTQERIFGILDSMNDGGQNSNAGQTDPVGHRAFMDGFRWNHHLYCGEVGN